MLEEPSGYWRRQVAVLKQREEGQAAVATTTQNAPAGKPWNLNTFLRWSHFNVERRQEMRFVDTPGSGWRYADFAGHCSGLSPVRRALCISVLLGNTVTS